MRILRWLILVGSLALLALLVFSSGIEPIFRAFIRQGWAIIPYLVMTGCENSFHTLGWRFCFSKEHRFAVPFWRMFLVYQTGYALNLITPTAEVGGDVARGAVLEKYVPGSEAASSVIINKFSYSIARMIAAASLAGMTIAIFPVRGVSAWLIGLGSALTTLALLAFAYFQARGLFGPVLMRLAKIAGRRSQEWVRDNVGEMDRRLRAYYLNNRSDLFKAMLSDVGGFSVGIAQKTYLMSVLVDGFVFFSFRSLLVGAAVWGITQFIKMIFFFVAGEIGVHEGAHKLAFEAVGLPGASGVALSLVDRVDQLFWSVVGIVAYWFELAAKRQKPAAEARPGTSRPRSVPEEPVRGA